MRIFSYILYIFICIFDISVLRWISKSFIFSFPSGGKCSPSGNSIHQWRRSGVFIVNFEHISHLVLVFLLLNLSRSMPTGYSYEITQFPLELLTGNYKLNIWATQFKRKISRAVGIFFFPSFLFLFFAFIFPFYSKKHDSNIPHSKFILSKYSIFSANNYHGKGVLQAKNLRF